MKTRLPRMKRGGGGLAGAFPHLIERTRAHCDGNNGASGRRRAVAEFCKLLGREMREKTAGSVVDGDVRSGGLSPRLKQTLEHLLRGDGEKQIAAKLGLSQHTIHVYVKSLHKHYSVCSRSDLLAHFIAK